MSIKHIALRSHDGHATDPTRPGSTIRAGIGGNFEVLASDRADGFRVSVGGGVCERNRWPATIKPGKHKVLIEQIVADAVVDAVTGEVEVVDPSPATPETDAKTAGGNTPSPRISQTGKDEPK